MRVYFIRNCTLHPLWCTLSITVNVKHALLLSLYYKWCARFLPRSVSSLRSCGMWRHVIGKMDRHPNFTVLFLMHWCYVSATNTTNTVVLNCTEIASPFVTQLVTDWLRLDEDYQHCALRQPGVLSFTGHFTSANTLATDTSGEFKNGLSVLLCLLFKLSWYGYVAKGWDFLLSEME